MKTRSQVQVRQTRRSVAVQLKMSTRKPLKKDVKKLIVNEITTRKKRQRSPSVPTKSIVGSNSQASSNGNDSPTQSMAGENLHSEDAFDICNGFDSSDPEFNPIQLTLASQRGTALLQSVLEKNRDAEKAIPKNTLPEEKADKGDTRNEEEMEIPSTPTSPSKSTEEDGREEEAAVVDQRDEQEMDISSTPTSPFQFNQEDGPEEEVSKTDTRNVEEMEAQPTPTFPSKSTEEDRPNTLPQLEEKRPEGSEAEENTADKVVDGEAVKETQPVPQLFPSTANEVTEAEDDARRNVLENIIAEDIDEEEPVRAPRFRRIIFDDSDDNRSDTSQRNAENDYDSDGSDIIQLTKREWKAIKEKLEANNEAIRKLTLRLPDHDDDDIKLPAFPITEMEEFIALEKKIDKSHSLKKALITEIKLVGGNEPIVKAINFLVVKSVAIKLSLRGTVPGTRRFDESPVFTCLIEGLKRRLRDNFQRTKVETKIGRALDVKRGNAKQQKKKPQKEGGAA